MASKNFSQFASRTSLLTSDYIIGYRNTDEFKTQINDINSVVTDTLTDLLVTKTAFNNYQTDVANTTATLLPTSVYRSASGSFATNTALNAASALLTPLTLTDTLTSLLVTNTAFSNYQTDVANTTATLLPTSVYQSASANWQNTFTAVQSNSANWNTGFNTGTVYSQNSASYATNDFVNSNFFNLTGGTISGATSINNNLTVFGNLTATGTTTFANTVFTTTSALSVVNIGSSGPALYVGNNGSGDIASFYDIDQNVEVLHVGGNNGSFPNVGVKTSSPNVDLTVNGQISANSTIWSANGNSNNWNNAFNIATTYQSVSSSFATNTLLQSTSALLTPLTLTRNLTSQLVTNTVFNNYQTSVAASTATFATNTIGFFDDFGDSRYYPVSSTIIHNVSTARITQTGDPYYIALLNSPPPRVTLGGGLTSVDTPLYYLGSTVPSTSGNMSLGFTFQLDRTNITGVGANIFNISFLNTPIIQGNPGSINPTGVVHINFTRLGVSTIDYFNTGVQLSCVNAFYDGTQYPFGTTPMRLDAEYAILLKVSGNYLTITVPGMGSLVFYDKDLSTKVGTSKTYFWWEVGNGNFFGISSRLYKIWGGPSPQILDSDPSCGGFVGGNIPFLHGSGPIQLPATIQSYGATNWAPTQVQNRNAIPAGAYGLVVAGNGTTGANSYTTGGNSYFEGLVLANLERTSIGGSAIGYGTFEIPSGVNTTTSTATTGTETVLSGISRLQNVQAGDRQTIEIIGTILGGTNTISVRVFATNETAITYTGSATGTFRITINRKTTTTNTDQVYAEFWIGTSLIATNRIAFNNTNFFPYQFRVTQSIASQVIVDDIRNTVQKVNIR